MASRKIAADRPTIARPRAAPRISAPDADETRRAMSERTKETPFALVPESDVAVETGRFVSLSTEPWLRIDADFGESRFVEIIFRASLLDDPVRPVLRFLTASGVVDRILPGPVAGAGVWRGAAPKGARAALVSPVARPGPFFFEIESIRPVGLLEMLASTASRKPTKLWSYFLPTLFGFVAEAENALDWANNFEPLENFESWLARRERHFDPIGVDAPRHARAEGPLFSIVVEDDESRPTALAATIESVRAQAYERLRLVVVADGEATSRAVSAHSDPRFQVVARGEAAAAALAEADFVARLRPGDRLAAHALACFAEEAARSPRAALLYADEIVEADGARRPTFKPDWSPVFEASRPYLGRCAFLAVSALSEGLPARLDDASLADALRAATLGLPIDETAHLRRWLMSRPETEEASAPRLPPAAAAPPPSVSIILLTRDRPDILAPCLDSVLRLTTHPSFELVVVDNGSRRADTLAILAAAAKDERVCVLERPEPFNFARLNNEAARIANGRVLVFLNNDTVVVEGDWLERLAEAAVEPDAGAVGALLLFPDGRIQHAGVVVGLGQDAGHFGALVPPDAPCWLDRARHAHETAAVTAACMAVERRKFEAVGGFDAANLPIEFNDVDLCLRLREQGWTSRYVPAARLIHLESATRGNAMLRPMSVYAKERDYFRDRWRAVIRDDPYYHPALSLYARRPALW
jgi:GT2 family glycosyltransferase